MSDQQLILVPENPRHPALEPQTIRAALRACGFSGESVVAFGDVHQLPGQHFLTLLPFFDSPPTGKLWAPHTIELRGPLGSVEFLGGADTEDPSCPTCSATVASWPDVLSDWYDHKDVYAWSCPVCGTDSQVWELDWHNSCGFGHQAIVVWHVGYRAAAPSERLLAVLKALGVGPWLHFHYRL